MPMEGVHSEGVPSDGLNSTPDINKPKRGIQTRKNFQVLEIDFIPPVRRINIRWIQQSINQSINHILFANMKS